MKTDDTTRPVKMSMQEKIAELERRIIDLESKKTVVNVTTTTTTTKPGLDINAEIDNIFKSVDAMFKKVFKR